jgi:HAD superfamily hydrolase (TIGR01459 family)
LKIKLGGHIITEFNTNMTKYKTLLVDLWGVVHDGTFLYEGVKERLIDLKYKNIEVCFLSNAPRRSAKAISVLNSLGIDSSLFKDVVTSGECFYYFSKDLITQKGNKIFYIGPKKDLDVLVGLDYSFTTNPKDASFGIITGHPEDYEESKMTDVLTLCVKNNLDIFCLNPDLIVVKKDGTIEPCAGAIGAEYVNLGGNLRYFGKPYLDIYHFAMERLGLSISDKANILAIGDSILTDIQGANNFGIDSCFCLSGIHKNQAESMGLELFLDSQLSRPTFCIDSFSNLNI